MLNNKALPSFIGILWYPCTSVRRSVVALVYSHLPCEHSRGLCRCLWPGQSHRSWPLYCQKAKCSWLPGLGEYTVIETQITTHMNHTFTSIRTKTLHQYQYRTLREARNSIPRATWKLKEMRSSRNKGVGSRGRKRGGGVCVWGRF